MRWLTVAYLVTLSALVRVDGSLDNRLGRHTVFITASAFTVESTVFGLAGNVPTLTAARAEQDMCAALICFWG